MIEITYQQYKELAEKGISFKDKGGALHLILGSQTLLVNPNDEEFDIDGILK